MWVVKTMAQVEAITKPNHSILGLMTLRSRCIVFSRNIEVLLITGKYRNSGEYLINN